MITWLPIALTVLSLSPAPGGPAGNDPPVPYGALLNEPCRRVRTTDKLLLRLMEDGLRRSVTFGDLVAAVNATDVIVYIQRVAKLAPSIAGQLMIVPVRTAQRYLRIQVLDGLTPFDTIALIGHELQHALEVAAAPDVRDQRGLTELYERIGTAGSQGQSYDTTAAQNTGRRVRLELAG